MFFFYKVHLQRVTAYKIESIFQLKFLPYSVWPWFLDKSTLVKWRRLCCLFQTHKGSWSLQAMFDLHTYLPFPLPPHPAPQFPESRAGFSFPLHPSLTQHSTTLLHILYLALVSVYINARDVRGEVINSYFTTS